MSCADKFVVWLSNIAANVSSRRAGSAGQVAPAPGTVSAYIEALDKGLWNKIMDIAQANKFVV